MPIICPTGAHDSFTYRLSDPLCHGASCIAHLDCSRNLTKKWAITQKMNATEQLKAGYRYYDFRVGFDCKQLIYRVCHTLMGDNIEGIMVEISDFLSDHSKEVVLLDFNHFYGMDAEKHARLLDMIIDTYGSKLCPAGIPNDITLDYMWQNGYQVLVFYHDDLAFSYKQIWSKF